MSAGEDYAEGPQAAAIARLVRETVEPGDAVGVKVIEGAPPHIVVLVHFSDDEVEGLRDLGAGRRREYIDAILETIDAEGYSDGCSVGVGIRGRIFYGAVGVRRLGQETEYDLAAVAQTAALDALFTPSTAPVAAPTPPSPAAPGPYASVLAQLNDLCGDTWCEGEHDYRFVAMQCANGQCTVNVEVRTFDPSRNDLGDPTRHTLELGRVEPDDGQGNMSEQLGESVSAAIARFEGQ
jgi:hypothetical protein